jgi:hypothetical protein
MLTVGTRFTVSPAQTGVTLSFVLTLQQVGIKVSVYPIYSASSIPVLRLDDSAISRSREQHELC